MDAWVTACTDARVSVRRMTDQPRKYKLRDLTTLRADSVTYGKQRPEDPLADLDMAMMGGNRPQGVADWIEDVTGLGPWTLRELDRNHTALEHKPDRPEGAEAWISQIVIGLDAIHVGSRGAPRTPYSLIVWWSHESRPTETIELRGLKTQTQIARALLLAFGPRGWR